MTIYDVLQRIYKVGFSADIEKGYSSITINSAPEGFVLPTEAELLSQVDEAKEIMGKEQLRIKRNILLAETDWMASSDLTISDAWKTYRQELRDLPLTATVDLDSSSKLTGVTWPTKPE